MGNETKKRKVEIVFKFIKTFASAQTLKIHRSDYHLGVKTLTEEPNSTSHMNRSSLTRHTKQHRSDKKSFFVKLLIQVKIV